MRASPYVICMQCSSLAFMRRKGKIIDDHVDLSKLLKADNSNQGQIVTNIGYYLGLLVANSNDSLVILPRPN